MAFADEFAAHFTDDEKNSVLYNILQSIGFNTEKSLYEAISAETGFSTELVEFPEKRLRSWISFFLEVIPNRIPAHGSMSITASNNFSGSITIPRGSVINTQSGKAYETALDYTISAGQTLSDVLIVQGHSQSYTATYDTIMSIDASGVSIDTITDLNGDGVADYFSVSINDSRLNPVTVVAPVEATDYGTTTVIPTNGYFAFYFDEKLWVKIYKGLNVPDPQGSSVTVNYRVCDGLAGNIGANTITSFESAFSDVYGNVVSFTFSNSPIANGSNGPTKGDLINILRRRFFITTNVSSVPEYELWFKSQTGVGDALVTSDYTDWVKNNQLNIDSNGNIKYSGKVKVYLVDADAEVISEETARLTYDEDLSKVRDLAFVYYQTPHKVNHAYVVRYTSVSNATEFHSWVETVLNKRYDVTWNKDNGYSLFKDLELDSAFNEITTSFSPRGLNIIPYHFKAFRTISGDAINGIPCFEGEKPEGFYLWVRLNPSDLKYYVVKHQAADGTIYPEIWTESEIIYDNNIASYPISGLKTGDALILRTVEGSTANNNLNTEIVGVKYRSDGDVNSYVDISWTYWQSGPEVGSNPSPYINHCFIEVPDGDTTKKQYWNDDDYASLTNDQREDANLLFCYWPSENSGINTVGWIREIISGADPTDTETRLIPGVRYLANVMIGAYSASIEDMFGAFSLPSNFYIESGVSN